MHVITSILFLWMQTLTFVRSQEGCTLQQFFKSSHYDEHFDTSNLEDSYPLGKQVRVNCNVGYTGFFKLICVEGTWQPKGAKCQPKSCGHPGDAQFADFALVQGDDFVFGSKVLYTCQKGYQMVSRTNSRLCMAGGWDGVVPVCEAQQCPAIHVDSNVLVTGDPDEATFGNVVRFSCKSNSEMLDGSVEIYCDENGDWSGHAPKCKEISCEAPVIENGDVPEKKQKYNEHEVLHFVCNPSFQRTEDRPSKCTKHVSKAQWNPTPLCEPIKCKLSQSTLGGATYDPAYRNVFLPGDTLRVTCGEKYFISEPEYTSKVTTCGEDGEWTIRPVCQEVRCSNQRDPRVYSWDVYWGQIVTLDETVRYRCRSGYKSPNGRHLARCTRQGWTPDPLCRATTCDPRRFPDADPTHPFKFQYSYNDRVRYTCKEGYTGQFTLTCKDDGWTGSPRCTAITCDPRRVSNADPEGGFKYKYQYNEQVRYICQEGYRGEFTLKCGEQGLTEWIGSAQCAAITCDPRKVSNADLEGGFKYKYQYNEQVRYICQEGYRGEFTLKCGEQGLTEWIGSAQCAVSELTCDIENDPNAVIDGTPKDKYKNKEKVKYNCKNGGHFILTCDETRWVGSRECTGTACTKPSISNGFVVGPINQMVYFACDEGYKLFTKGWWGAAKCDGRDWSMLDRCIVKNKCGKTPVIANGEVAEETGQVTCNEGYRPQVYILTCDKGIWTFDGFTPTTICGSVGNHCSPPPKVENAVVKSAPTKEYFSGSDVTYQCRDDYELQGEKTIECQDGTWEEKNITCTEITCDLKDYPNAAIDGTPKDKYKIKAEVKVNCEDGGHFTLTCGKMGWIASGQCTVPTDDSDFSDAGPVGPPKPIQ